MNKICTSIEQSKKLIELGIDEDTSDMVYLKDYFLGDEEEEDDEEDYNLLVGSYHEGYAETDDGSRIPLFVQHIPAWSLSALLDLPPKGEDNGIDLCFGGYKGEEYIDEWFCTFEDNKEPFEFHTCNNKDKLDAVFEMVCWLKENGKI
jgi:hypothetical protein